MDNVFSTLYHDDNFIMNPFKDDTINLPDTPEKWRMLSTTTGGYINAGTYKVVITAPDLAGVAFDALEIQ